MKNGIFLTVTNLLCCSRDELYCVMKRYYGYAWENVGLFPYKHPTKAAFERHYISSPWDVTLVRSSSIVLYHSNIFLDNAAANIFWTFFPLEDIGDTASSSRSCRIRYNSTQMTISSARQENEI